MTKQEKRTDLFLTKTINKIVRCCLDERRHGRRDNIVHAAMKRVKAVRRMHPTWRQAIQRQLEAHFEGKQTLPNT